MLRTLTRQTLAVVVALAVVCSFVGAPVAAATLGTQSDGNIDGLDSGSETSMDTTGGEADTSDGGENSTDGDDGAADDDASTDDGAADDDASTDDGATDDDPSTDDGDDGNSSDDRSLGSDDTDGGDGDRDSRTDRLEELINGTSEAVANATDGLEDSSTDALEGGEATVDETVDRVVTYAELEEALGLQGLFVGSLEYDADRTVVTHDYDRTVASDRRAPPSAAAGSEEGTEASGADASAVADEGGEGEEPEPPSPASGATIGFGAIATAAALRGSPVVTGSRAARSSGLVSRLLEKVRPFVLPLRYSRYDDSDPLEHEARERVYDIVNETPGSYLSEVSQEADLPLSTTRHHIKVLEREDLVTGAKLHGKRRFYPAYAEGIELSAALNDESTASIIRAIARVGAASVSDLADELGRDPSTISHHLQRLDDDGVITRERDGRAVVNKLSTEARTALEPETAPEPRERGEVVAGGAD
jgi:DNA-binding transcriptional ArsR family regulator